LWAVCKPDFCWLTCCDADFRSGKSGPVEFSLTQITPAVGAQHADGTSSARQPRISATRRRQRAADMQLTGPNTSVEFNSQADDLGVTAVRYKSDSTGDQRRVDLTHLRYVSVCVALKYLQTPPHTRAFGVNGDRHIHRVTSPTQSNTRRQQNNKNTF